MSRKTEEDYVAVLRAILDSLQDTEVMEFMVDFEVGAWQAIRRVFPAVSIKGCVFHWTQAVWKHVQTCGLVKVYREQQGVHAYIRQLLALPFLPAQHNKDTFLHLKARANSPQLQDLVDYMDRQWFRNQVFKVHDWSVFQRTIHTNNDVEGWHNRLNTIARHCGVAFYSLVPQLRREADLVNLAVCAGDLDRDVNRQYTALEKRIQTAWEQYMSDEWSTTRFLRSISQSYCPTDKFTE